MKSESKYGGTILYPLIKYILIGFPFLLYFGYGLLKVKFDDSRAELTFMRPSFLRFKDVIDHTSSNYGLFLYSEQSRYNFSTSKETYDITRENFIHIVSSENRQPLIFVHGHGGSYKQCRSFASEALKFANRTVLDYFCVDFREEWSAISACSIKNQISFLKYVIQYVSSMYNTKVILLGHSMGGVVCNAAIYSGENYMDVSDLVSLVVTLCTPHSKLPIMLDWDIDYIFRKSLNYLYPPLVNVVSGSRDLMIPYELSIIPESSYRLTVFTSEIPFVWGSYEHDMILWSYRFAHSFNEAIIDSLDESDILKSFSKSWKYVKRSELNEINYNLQHGSVERFSLSLDDEITYLKVNFNDLPILFNSSFQDKYLLLEIMNDCRIFTSLVPGSNFLVFTNVSDLVLNDLTRIEWKYLNKFNIGSEAVPLPVRDVKMRFNGLISKVVPVGFLMEFWSKTLVLICPSDENCSLFGKSNMNFKKIDYKKEPFYHLYSKEERQEYEKRRSGSSSFFVIDGFKTNLENKTTHYVYESLVSKYLLPGKPNMETISLIKHWNSLLLKNISFQYQVYVVKISFDSLEKKIPVVVRMRSLLETKYFSRDLECSNDTCFISFKLTMLPFCKEVYMDILEILPLSLDVVCLKISYFDSMIMLVRKYYSYVFLVIPTFFLLFMVVWLLLLRDCKNYKTFSIFALVFVFNPATFIFVTKNLRSDSSFWSLPFIVLIQLYVFSFLFALIFVSLLYWLGCIFPRSYKLSAINFGCSNIGSGVFQRVSKKYSSFWLWSLFKIIFGLLVVMLFPSCFGFCFLVFVLSKSRESTFGLFNLATGFFLFILSLLPSILSMKELVSYGRLIFFPSIFVLIERILLLLVLILRMYKVSLFNRLSLFLLSMSFLMSMLVLTDQFFYTFSTHVLLVLLFQ